MSALRGQFSAWNTVGAGDNFPNPFFQVADLAQPSSMRNALYWSEFIFNHFGTYRMAMERIVSYFLTDIRFKNLSEDEKEKWEPFINQTLDLMTVSQNMLRNRMCFHGDVKAITRGGVFKLRDLAGKTVDVLSKDGVYRKAEFKSFGRQELLEVEFSDGRTVLATPDHQWYVKNCSDKEVKVPTTALCKGYRVPRVVAPRPEKNEDYYEGVRHGFTFGDGSLYNKGEQACAWFFGHKDAAVLPYFDGHGCKPIPKPDRDATVINGLPAHYKALPRNEKSASFWYGFVCGFLAADGSVDTYGCALLTQKAKATLDLVAEQLPRIGMVGGPVRGHFATREFVREDGSVDVYHGKMHYVTLLKRFMRPEDFLIPAHRDNFEKHFEKTNYGEYVGIKAVHKTGIVDEVFCCVEMETHSFVIENAVLSANCYGNSFASMLVPIKRFLGCPKCGSNWPLDVVFDNKVFAFQFNIPDFLATCPTCKVASGHRGAFHVNDKPDDEEKKLKIKIWNPHEIELLHDPLTNDVHYLWRIPEDYKRLVRQGNLFHLERVSKGVLKAIHRNTVFRFFPDTVFHMKEPTLGGILNRGWGIPRIITNFRQIFYVQVLRRMNEAIAMDYVIPTRLITPGTRQGTQAAGGQTIDPLATFYGADFRNAVKRMWKERRRDPAGIQILPYPVNYQVLGAEANQLAPRELLDQGTELLLNDAGTPVDLYKGSLQLQTAPVALRLFEATWQHLVHDVNAFIRWTVEQVSQILSWETVEAGLKRVTIADDLQKQMALLQLMASQLVSGTTALAPLDVDWQQEQNQIAEEARESAEIQARTQEEMQESGYAQQMAKGQMGGQQGGDPSQGGGQGGQGGGQGGGGGGQGPSAAGAMQTPFAGPVSQYISSMSPNVPQTPQDMQAVAESIATDLSALPAGIQNSELRKLKQANEVLHDLVKARLDSMRSQVKSQAGNQAWAQMQQGGGQQQGG